MTSREPSLDKLPQQDLGGMSEMAGGEANQHPMEIVTNAP